MHFVDDLNDILGGLRRYEQESDTQPIAGVFKEAQKAMLIMPMIKSTDALFQALADDHGTS